MTASQSSSMRMIADVARTVVPSRADPDSLLPPLLLMLTVVTGVVDAVSYLKFGHVFVANMTGNIVFLGFALAGAGGLSVASSLVALAAFPAGAVAGGRLGIRLGARRARLLTIAILVEVVLVAAALVIAALSGNDVAGNVVYALIGLLAFAMGLQNATARRLAVPDLTTTVLTLTITGLAADSRLAGGSSPVVGRRLAAVVAMFAGAAVGGSLVLHVTVTASLGLATGLLLVAGLAGLRVSSGATPHARSSP